jgi:hypothetical protein
MHSLVDSLSAVPRFSVRASGRLYEYLHRSTPFGDKLGDFICVICSAVDTNRMCRRHEWEVDTGSGMSD